MAMSKQRADLEIFEDMMLQRRTWLVERAAWIVLGAILSAALLGFFGGGGPAANAETTSADGSLSTHYARFGRREAPTELRVVATPPADGGATLRLWLSREYIEAHEITSVVPPPSRVEAASDRYVFEFPLVASGETATILFRLEPRKAWRIEGRLGIDGGARLRFDQFVYP